MPVALSSNIRGLVDTVRQGDWKPSADSLVEGRRRIGDGIQALLKRAETYCSSVLDGDFSGASGNTGDKPRTYPPYTWDTKRLQAIECIWGDCFMEPGGEDFAAEFLGLKGFNKDAKVLDLTTGLGGTALTAIERKDLWVEAMEPVESLFDSVLKLNKDEHRVRKFKHHNADLRYLELPKERYDLVYTRERLFTVHNKAEVLKEVVESLKPGGTLVISDYMAVDVEGRARLLGPWSAMEPARPSLWTLAQYQKAFEDLGLTIEHELDFTKKYLELVLKGWHRAKRKVAKNKSDREFTDYLLREGDIWLARVNALNSGALCVRRICASTERREEDCGAKFASINELRKSRGS